MPLDIETALDWRGRTVVDRDGDKIGTFDELYLDEDDRPEWAAVTTGLFGRRQTFVPLSEAQADGDVLRVPFAKDVVKEAPSVDPDEQLSPEEEDALYRHYGLRGAAATDDADTAPAPSEAEAAGDGDDNGAEMIRSEEEVDVGTRRRVAGKARLKKHVVTDHVQKTVPVQREEVRVEFEPAEGEER
jgi:Domain of unknown function (DUF2382)/PRC-barrel domain